MRKKGEITTSYLIIIIILIVSFLVILYFLFFKLNLGRESDKEICHNSVVLSSTPGIKIFSGLDCKTNYLCISGGGKCEGINPTETVKVNPNNKEEIIKAIADEMADCWWMFGEGKLDYMRGKFVKNTACAICAIVRFDKKIQDKYSDGISYKEFLDYLSKQKRDETETYLYYLYGISDINRLFEENDLIRADYQSNSIFLKEEYIIMTGQVKEGFFGKIIKGFVRIFEFTENGKKEKRGYIVPYFFDSQEISGYGCDEFITKA